VAYSDSTLLVVLVRLRQTRIQESDMSATALQQMKNMKASNCGCDISGFKCDAPIPFSSVQLAIASGPGFSSLVEGLTASCSKKLEKHLIHLLVLSKRVTILGSGYSFPYCQLVGTYLSNDQLVGEEKGKEIIWMVKVAAGLHS
jgi:hypothetical protein